MQSQQRPGRAPGEGGVSDDVIKRTYTRTPHKVAFQTDDTPPLPCNYNYISQKTINSPLMNSDELQLLCTLNILLIVCRWPANNDHFYHRLHEIQNNKYKHGLAGCEKIQRDYIQDMRETD